jgi:hypothetical protein
MFAIGFLVFLGLIALGLGITGKGMLGAEATFNYNSGSFNSPSLTAMTAVSDLSMTGSWDKAEASTRFTRAKTYLKAMVDWSITGKLRSSPTGDANYQTFVTDFLGPDVTVNVVVLNGGAALNGAWGFMFDAQIFKMGGDQGLGVVEFDDIELAPAATGNPGQYAQVASGALVYTAI